MTPSPTRCGAPPPVRGTVYGVVLNDRASLAKLGAALDEVPYKGAPRAPAMYIKPANTLVGEGAVVRLPAGETAVEIGATVGIVIGTPAARLTFDTALATVAGYLLVADLSLPHASYYRPAIREKCFDGACPVGAVSSAALVRQIGTLEITTEIDGVVAETRRFDDLLRDPARLLADVSAFMTLSRGDMLLVGVRYLAPQAKVGSHVRISAPGLVPVEFSIAGDRS